MTEKQYISRHGKLDLNVSKMSVNHSRIPESYRARLEKSDEPVKSKEPNIVPDKNHVRNYLKKNYQILQEQRVHGEHIEHRETMGEHLRNVENMDNWSKVSNFIGPTKSIYFSTWPFGLARTNREI